MLVSYSNGKSHVMQYNISKISFVETLPLAHSLTCSTTMDKSIANKGSIKQSSSTPDKIAIHVSAQRGLIYSIEDVKRLREEFHICGTLIGILPQVPQQNVFQGLPLELMPEEIRYLVEERDAAYLVDSGRVHDLASFSFDDTDKERLESYRKERADEQIKRHKEMAEIKRQEAVAKSSARKKKSNNETAENKIPSQLTTHQTYETGTFYNIDSATHDTPVNLPSYELYANEYKTDTPVVFDSPTDTISKEVDVGTITLPPVKLPQRAAYSMYRHMQSEGYYLSPGFRFGGQFLAYPGDPLRYHSHHIAIGYEWDENFGVLDVIGGGRLGTAVKKCWYVGAEEPKDESGEGSDAPEFHGFSIEWSGFG